MDIFQEKQNSMQQPPPFIFLQMVLQYHWQDSHHEVLRTWSENFFLQNANWSQTEQTQKQQEPPELGVRGKKNSNSPDLY